MLEDQGIPRAPIISQQDIQRCRDSGDYRPVMFEWYKYVGLVCNLVASIRPESRAIRNLPSKNFGALIGLLNRCSRLMLSNVALSHDGLFGETTAIVDRCIFESCVKLMWLCHRGGEDDFKRFIADGVRTELELRREIEAKIFHRQGVVLQIEESMLSSIADAIASTGLSEDELSCILASRRLPDLRTMIDQIESDNLLYVVGQRIGSHHIHGTWFSLLFHYVREKEDGTFEPRDHDVATQINQYVYITTVVLWAIESYIRYMVIEDDIATEWREFVDGIREEIHDLNVEIVGNDFKEVDKS